jgi:hypothetical protein
LEADTKIGFDEQVINWRSVYLRRGRVRIEGGRSHHWPHPMKSLANHAELLENVALP